MGNPEREAYLWRRAAEILATGQRGRLLTETLDREPEGIRSCYYALWDRKEKSDGGDRKP